jgi:hypothetical protein
MKSVEITANVGGRGKSANCPKYQKLERLSRWVTKKKGWEPVEGEGISKDEETSIKGQF